VRWVKNAFFETRRFSDPKDLTARLAEWNVAVNNQERARGSGVLPQERMIEERVRLRPINVQLDDFALRIPVLVGPRPEVVYEGFSYPMPTETVGKRAMLYLYPGRVRIRGDGFDIERSRLPRWEPELSE
jgi:hypothetical protein